MCSQSTADLSRASRRTEASICFEHLVSALPSNAAIFQHWRRQREVCGRPVNHWVPHFVPKSTIKTELKSPLRLCDTADRKPS